MGGAFVAVADDATSVYSNPAGLTQLFLAEFSAEGRVWQHRSRLADRGHAFGPARGIGVDTIDGLQYRTWEETSAGLSFLSYVYPGSRWAIGGFRHQLAKIPDAATDAGPLLRLRVTARTPGDPRRNSWSAQPERAILRAAHACP